MCCTSTWRPGHQNGWEIQLILIFKWCLLYVCPVRGRDYSLGNVHEASASLWWSWFSRLWKAKCMRSVEHISIQNVWQHLTLSTKVWWVYWQLKHFDLSTINILLTGIISAKLWNFYSSNYTFLSYTRSRLTARWLNKCLLNICDKCSKCP